MTKQTEQKFWNGSKPAGCNICSGDYRPDGVFIDGRTQMGWWAVMCGRCHEHFGVGLGVGKGQRYELQEDGKWLKVTG